MTARPRDGMVAIAIAAVLLAGVALDAWGPKVSARTAPPSPDPAFTARAVFCPPALAKPATTTTVTTAARGDGTVSVGFEPAADDRVELAGGAVVQRKPPPPKAVDVVGYGGVVDSTAVTSIDAPISGVGAASCSPRASTRWYFPEGNSTVTHDERLLIYNPFPDEAVVRVGLSTPGGERVKAGLSDIAVPSESSIAVALEDFILEEKTLGAVVTTVRGRVVAWRLSIAEPEEKPSGVQFTLGTTTLDDTWYFPEGAVGSGFEERLSIMNPGDQEATVDVTLVTGSRTIPLSSEVAVAARSTVSIVLDDAALAGETGGAGAIVSSANGVPIVAERTVFYATEEIDGVASEIGSSTPSRRWFLGPATSKPETDSVVLLNASSEAARVSLTLLPAEGRPIQPAALQDLEIESSGRLRVPLSELTAGEAFAVLVDADALVVAERFSYSGAAGDVASLMGIPLD